MPESHIVAAIENRAEPRELAALLQACSPGRAYAFALTMHEQACEAGEPVWCALWGDVVAILRAQRDGMPAADLIRRAS